MALVVKDRVKVTSTTAGTGTFTLGSASLGFQDFSVIGDGNTTYYTIAGVGTTEWEVGIGTYTASGTTLSRDTILESSNSGSTVNFSAGLKEVFVTYPAEKAIYFNAADQLDVDNLRLDGNTISSTNTNGNVVLDPNGIGSVDVSSAKIINVATPTSGTDATNKTYVDEVAEGLRAKPAVELATTANLTANYYNGPANDGVGATLTATTNGAFPTIDGVTLTSTTLGQNGVLVKNQTAGLENGRYNLTTVGDGSNPWVLTRCALCDESDEIPGAYVFVKDGTLYAGTGWVQVVTDPATFQIGVDPIFVFQFSGAGTYTAGAGLDLNGTEFSVETNGITNAMLRQSAGLSVIGRSANTTGDVADITAANDNQVLRRSGTAVGFGAVNLASTDAVTGDLPFSNLAQGSALSVLGVTGNATADVASIAAGTDHQVLRRSGTSLAFGAISLTQSAAVTGILPVANGGTGDSSYTNGQLLIGNTTGNTLTKATLTAGTGISITNGAGSISVAATNNGTVTSVSGTGTVQGITLSGTVTSSGDLTLGGSLSAINLASQVTGDLPFSNLAQGSALSVLGVTGNATADVASIAAGTDHQVLRRSGTSVAFGAVNLAQSAAITGTLPVTNGGTGLTSLGSGVATWLGTPSSANLAAAVTDETGSGALVFATSPTLVTPALGTPSSGTLSSCTVDGTNAVGFRTIPQVSQSAAYTLVLTDSGKHILHPSADTTARTFTIPANSSVAFPIGTAITFVNQNGAGVVTIAITTDTMRLSPAGTTGSRTLAANGIATAIKLTSTEWIISGTGLT